MHSTTYKYLSFVLFIIYISIDHINCAKGKEKQSDFVTANRIRDMAQAINLMYVNLPADMSMEQKCKRYAVLSSLTLAEKVPSRSTVSKVQKMDEVELDKNYRAIGASRIGYAYMSAIDRFRVTRLAPSFLELIDCLKQIDIPGVKAYLDNQELVLIYDLYKQVLGLPGTKINLLNLDLTQFRRAFWGPFRNLFREHIDVDNLFSKFALDPDDPDFASSANSLSDEQCTDPKLRKQELLNQRKERSRLAKQRVKMMDPESVRRYQEQHRRQRAERERVAWMCASKTPEGFEIKLQEQAKRDRANERRRLRRHQLRAQKLHQKVLLGLAPPGADNPAQPAAQQGQHTHYEAPQAEIQIIGDQGEPEIQPYSPMDSQDPDSIVDNMTLEDLKQIDHSLSFLDSFRPIHELEAPLEPTQLSVLQDNTNRETNLPLSQAEAPPSHKTEYQDRNESNNF